MIARNALLVCSSVVVLAACKSRVSGTPDRGHDGDLTDTDAPGSTLPPGVADFVQQPVSYPPIYSPYQRELPGDKSNENGGTPPALRIEPADVPTTASTAGLTMASASYRPPNGEAKARFVCAASHIAPDDPLRSYGAPGRSHLHQFFGNPKTDAFSTYASLRANTEAATCSGGMLNNTGYWFPCFMKTLPDGQRACVRASQIVLYYVEGDLNLVPSLQRVFRGFGYVFGVNMDDPDDVGVKAEIAAANAASKAAGGSETYQYVGTGLGGYSCHTRDSSNTIVNGSGPTSPNAGNPVQPYLRNADGTPTLPNCPPDGRIRISLVSPACWDGVNLQSYGSGYKHVRQGIRERDTATEQICPSGWYRIPRFQLTVFFDYDNVDDFTAWRLSSDDHAEMVAGHTMENGRSFHTDWFGAWDYGTESNPGVMLKWLHNCTGVRRPDGTNTPHDCDASTIGPDEALNYGLVSQVPWEPYFIVR